MAKFNFFSQLFGSHEGHVLNQDIDSVGQDLGKELFKFVAGFAKSDAAAELTKLGYPGTWQGFGKFLDDRIEGLEPKALGALPAPVAQAIEGALNTVLSEITNALPKSAV